MEITEPAQELLFPPEIVKAFGTRPGWKNPEARLYKSLVARRGNLPNRILWYHQTLVASAYDAPSLTCPKCTFENIVACPEPAPKTRLHSNLCMKCGAELICPVCYCPLEIGDSSEADSDLLCTNPGCDVWIAIW